MEQKYKVTDMVSPIVCSKYQNNYIEKRLFTSIIFVLANYIICLWIQQKKLFFFVIFYCILIHKWTMFLGHVNRSCDFYDSLFGYNKYHQNSIEFLIQHQTNFFLNTKYMIKSQNKYDSFIFGTNGFGQKFYLHGVLTEQN